MTYAVCPSFNYIMWHSWMRNKLYWSNTFSLFQLETKTTFYKTCWTYLVSIQKIIFQKKKSYKETCNFEPFCCVIYWENNVSKQIEIPYLLTVFLSIPLNKLPCPLSRLGRLRKCRNMEEILEVCDGYDPDRNEFTFHRQPRNFNSVLNFMRTGKLHLGEETCVIAFSRVK